MGQKGYVTAFTESEVMPAADLLHQTCAALGIVQACEIMRTVGEDRSWAVLNNNAETIRPISRNSGATISIATSPGELEHLGYSGSIEQAARCITPGTSLRIALNNPAWADLDRALREEVPEQVRGPFVPSGQVLRVGWHDLYELLENPNGRLFGRAWYSLSFEGHGTPNDWEGFRQRIFETTVVKKTFETVEAIAGPLRKCVYWE